MLRKFVFFILLYCGAQITLAQTYTLCDKWVDCGKGCQLLDPYYCNGVSFEWSGGSKNGKADGYGTAKKYVNGEYESTYVGEYHNGIRSGKGTFTHKDGSTKTGTFVNGQLVGYGKMESEDGSSYEGEFINYRCHGNGKMRFGNGSTFEGFVVSDSPYTGKLTNYDGQTILLQEGEPVERISARKTSYVPKIGQRCTEYLDEEWKHCEAKNASYYRIITYVAPHTPKGIVKDYYITGELQGEGTFVWVDYSDDGKNFSEGEMKTYYRSGKVKSHTYYYNNKPNGPTQEYFENGSVKSETCFNHGTITGISKTYHENGNLSIIANYDNGELKGNKYLQFSEDGETCFSVYSEDFQQNRKNWEYEGQNGTLTVNADNSLSFEVAPERNVSGGMYANFTKNYNGIVDVAFNREEKSNVIVGLLIGFKDWDNYCGIYIADNSFLFKQVRYGKDVGWHNWQLSDAIKQDINHLRIINIGEQITVEINGTQVILANRPLYQGDFICLTAVNNSTKPCNALAGALTICEVVNDEAQIKDYLPSESLSNGEWRCSGSGFFINENGYIATNYHVVENGKNMQVTFIRNGQAEHWPVEIVLSDKQNDLAILRISDHSFTPTEKIPYGISTGIKDTGSEVFTLGYPMADVMGSEVKFTDGKISSRTGIQGDVTVYQISVPIQPGNSGGPLFDSNGSIVGITSSGLNRDYFKSENVNYAIKASYLKSLVDAMPSPVELPSLGSINNMPLTEKIKNITPFVVYLQVR